MIKKIHYMLATLVISVSLTVASTADTQAKEFTQFLTDFSLFCVGGVGDPSLHKEIAKSEGWKSVPEKFKPLLKSANGNDFDGWSYKRDRGIIYIIAFFSEVMDGKPVHGCSLMNFDADYKTNVEKMKQSFKAKRFNEYSMGVQYTEIFSIKLPQFSKAMIVTNQDRSRPKGSDMFKFDLLVFE